MRKKFIGVMLTAAMTAGLTGCGGSEGISADAATADTQATEAQKGEAKDNAKKGDERENSEASGSKGASDFHIGVITGSVSQSGDDRHGTEALQAMYGEDVVKLTVYPDNFAKELETAIQTIISLSDDPKMKAIIMNQSVPGTTEAFRKVKETRPDILCIAGEGHEDLPEIGGAADLVCNNDFTAHGYLIIHTVHELGCDTSVHISFPRRVAYEIMSRHVAVMKETCKEFGMGFVLETIPDPTSGVGIAGVQAYILGRVPEWVEKYDKDAAYFCANDAHIELLLKQLMEYGDYFIGAGLPSPLMGYPGALGIDLTAEAGDFGKILTKVESTTAERGDADHFGAWAYSYGYTASAGLAQHALNVLNDESELDDIDDIAKAYQIFSSKVEWNGSNYTNVGAGVKLDNVFLIYQDTYIMGDPGHFMGSTKIEVPERYFTIK